MMKMFRKIFRKLGNLDLPCFLKIFFWKLAGFRIGRGAKIGKNVRIICKYVEIGDYVTIKDNVKIIGLKKLKIGNFTYVGERVYIAGDSELHIGENCFIGVGSIINVREKVEIGDNTALAGAYVQIWTHSTWMEEIKGYNVKNKILPVKIGNNCYVGAGAIILPGVKVGNGSVIGAGAVVTRSIPSRELWVGIPARFVKKIKSKMLPKEKIREKITSFLKDHEVTDFSFYPDISGKVIFTFGEKLPENLKKDVFDLSNKVAVVKSKLGVKVRKLLNMYLVRFRTSR